MKEDCEEALKNLTIFFILKSVPFHGQDYEKQKELGVTKVQVTKQVQKIYFISNTLRDQVC